MDPTSTSNLICCVERESHMVQVNWIRVFAISIRCPIA